MLPVIILVSSVLVISTNFIANSWTTIRLQYELTDMARHLGYTIRQLYYTYNSTAVSTATIVKLSDLPTTVELYTFIATGSLSSVYGVGSIKDLQLTLSTVGSNSVAETITQPLGINVNWLKTTLVSNSATAGIQLQKFTNGTVTISFR